MRLAQLSMESSLEIATVLSDLANVLFHDVRIQPEAMDGQETIILRAHYVQQTTQVMIGRAQRITEIGIEMRTNFSRLLTEHLASGSQGLMDAFQCFFKVLPTENLEFNASLQDGLNRTNTVIEQINLVFAAASSGSSDLAHAHAIARECSYPLQPC